MSPPPDIDWTPSAGHLIGQISPRPESREREQPADSSARKKKRDSKTASPSGKAAAVRPPLGEEVDRYI